VHLVMVPNPPYHAEGDFFFAGDRIVQDGSQRLTFGNIGIYDTALFRELPREVKLKMLPLYQQWIGLGLVSGERYDGPWTNIGTPADLAALDREISASGNK
jgi:N-acetyl-alpha-D-muramate 1-phosphate uridylyltransferase